MSARSAALATFWAAMAIGVTTRAGPPDAQDMEIRLSWVREEGAADCPDARVIEQRAKAWLGRDPFSPAAETAAEITVARRADGFVARIRVRGKDGVVVGERVLTSEEPRCETLASAVAFALALQVDPEAALRPKRLAKVEPPPRAAPAAPAPPERTAKPVEPPRRTSPREASLSVGAVAVAGLVPGLAGGARLAAGLAWTPRWRVVLSTLLVPEQRTADRSVGFGLSALGAGACLDLLDGSVAQLAPCAELHGGEVHALVYALEPAPPGTRFWSAASAAARLKFRVFKPLSVELGAGLVLPFTRPRFQVEGRSDTVFRQSIVAPTADVSLGLTFP